MCSVYVFGLTQNFLGLVTDAWYPLTIKMIQRVT